MSILSCLSDGINRVMRFSAHDRRRLSRQSGIADGHACNGARTSRSGKACSKEVRVGSAALIARYQRRVISSHDGLVVFFVVTLDVRHVTELARSPLDVVVTAGLHTCGDGFDSVGWRERAVGWVEVVIVLGEHEVGFHGIELVWIDAISTDWLA